MGGTLCTLPLAPSSLASACWGIQAPRPSLSEKLGKAQQDANEADPRAQSSLASLHRMLGLVETRSNETANRQDPNSGLAERERKGRRGTAQSFEEVPTPNPRVAHQLWNWQTGCSQREMVLF